MSKEFENINLDEINLEEYEDVKVEMDDIKKAKMKKELRAKIMDKNKRSKKTIAIAASLSLIMTLGIVSQPAIAQNIPIFNTAYEALGFSKKNLALSKYIGMIVEDNGTKVTIDDVTANENSIRLTVKMESKNEEFIKDHEGIFFRANFGGVESNSLSTEDTIVDKNTKLMVIDINSAEIFPESGRLIVSLNNDRYDFEGEFKLDIDFKESFSKEIRRDLKLEKKIDGVNIYGFKSAATGILLEVSQGSVGGKNKERLYLKVDGKIYASDGGFGSGKSNVMYLKYETLTAEELINAKEISVIAYSFIGPVVEPIEFGPGHDEKLQAEKDKKLVEETKEAREEDERKYNEAERETTNGITYVKEYNFTNGGKSEIYKTERENGLIKMYIKGDNKGNSLSLADGIAIYQQSGGKSTLIEKNSMLETEDGYIVEFNDTLEGDLRVHGDYPAQRGAEWNEFDDEVKLIMEE